MNLDRAFALTISLAVACTFRAMENRIRRLEEFRGSFTTEERVVYSTSYRSKNLNAFAKRIYPCGAPITQRFVTSEELEKLIRNPDIEGLTFTVEQTQRREVSGWR